MSGEITHDGIIKKITADKIVVGFVNASACADCHAKGACMASDMQDKEVEIAKKNDNFKVGQNVVIIGSVKQGFKALIYGYLLPLIILLLVLATLISLNVSENISAIVAVGTLAPYYMLLYALRNTIKRKFEFEIKSI